MEITHIIKRDFSTKEFHLDKITSAVFKAMNVVGKGTQEKAEEIASSAYKSLLIRKEIDAD